MEREKLNPAWIDSLLIYTMLGTVIGARLGHCLFYAPDYYLANPLEILKVWEGGLASHGGTLGIIIAIYFYSKRVSHRSMLDIRQTGGPYRPCGCYDPIGKPDES